MMLELNYDGKFARSRSITLYQLRIQLVHPCNEHVSPPGRWSEDVLLREESIPVFLVLISRHFSSLYDQPIDALSKRRIPLAQEDDTLISYMNCEVRDVECVGCTSEDVVPALCRLFGAPLT
ncbi:unnamed protein product [Strongylus vulgaris]|uniref:Uncharacterized protein n=1 Tax=Strongylus vulgaris TaxID=40348 RepID=A0A3P7HYU7_STRVU|nr:unnamed protein product [Strongylus vulgaris]